MNMIEQSLPDLMIRVRNCKLNASLGLFFLNPEKLHVHIYIVHLHCTCVHVPQSLCYGTYTHVYIHAHIRINIVHCGGGEGCIHVHYIQGMGTLPFLPEQHLQNETCYNRPK